MENRKLNNERAKRNTNNHEWTKIITKHVNRYKKILNLFSYRLINRLMYNTIYRINAYKSKESDLFLKLNSRNSCLYSVFIFIKTFLNAILTHLYVVFIIL